MVTVFLGFCHYSSMFIIIINLMQSFTGRRPLSLHATLIDCISNQSNFKRLLNQQINPFSKKRDMFCSRLFLLKSGDDEVKYKLVFLNLLIQNLLMS